MIIYHNPRCSKSRQALGILRENAEEPEVVEYLKEPLGQAELGALLQRLKVPAHNLLRTKEDEYTGLGDVVESTLSTFGITEERFKAWFNLKECNCNKRKKWLNNLFSWRK